jgi:hypothetical protein
MRTGREKPRIFRGYDAVALASGPSKFLHIGNPNAAPARLDRSDLFEPADHRGHAGPPDPESLRNQILGYGDFIALDTIAHDQQPTCKPLLNRVTGIAKAHLRVLDKQNMDVALQGQPHRGQPIQQVQQIRCADGAAPLPVSAPGIDAANADFRAGPAHRRSRSG